MNHITENNDPEGALQWCAAKCEQEGNTDTIPGMVLAILLMASVLFCTVQEACCVYHKSRAIRNHGTTSRQPRDTISELR